VDYWLKAEMNAISQNTHRTWNCKAMFWMWIADVQNVRFYCGSLL